MLNFNNSDNSNTATKFNVLELNQEKLQNAIINEAKTIYESSVASRHYNGRKRTLAEIIETIRPSKTCEEYLVQKENFIYNLQKWHDVISPKGHLVEVKVIKNNIKKENYNNYAKGIYNKIKKYNSCEYIYMYKNNGNGNFELVYIYDTKTNTNTNTNTNTTKEKK